MVVYTPLPSAGGAGGGAGGFGGEAIPVPFLIFQRIGNLPDKDAVLMAEGPVLAEHDDCGNI